MGTETRDEKADATAVSTKPDDHSTEWDEYKLLQDKIDRIGDFHFRIRTWAVTLLTALVGSGIAGRVSSLTILAMTVLLIAAFSVQEYSQATWRRTFGRRVEALEAKMRRADGRGPAIAREIGRTKRSQRGISRFVLRFEGRLFYIVVGLMAATTVLLTRTPGSPAEGVQRDELKGRAVPKDAAVTNQDSATSGAIAPDDPRDQSPRPGN